MLGMPWNASGYEGFKVGHLQYGERYDGCLLRLGASVAHSHWQRAFALARKCTRIDLQVTFRSVEEPGVVIHRHYKELLKHNRKFKKAPAVAMLLAHDGSRTVYSGRRSSDVFGRIYDKHKESGLKEFQNCVRYEVEFKGRRAQAMAHRLITSSNPQLETVGHVCRMYSNRGCSLRRLTNAFRGCTSIDALTCPVLPNDVDRKLQWLRVAIRPTVALVAERRGIDTIQELFGLH